MTRADNANKVSDAIETSLSGHVLRPEVRPLTDLVSFLSGAIDALDGKVESVWLAELRSAWWPLEHVNAEALSEGRSTLTPDEVRFISDSRDELLAVLLAGREAGLSLTHDQALLDGTRNRLGNSTET